MDEKIGFSCASPNFYKYLFEYVDMTRKKKKNKKRESLPYTMKDVTKVTEDIINLNKEKKYNPGAFIHGLIFTLEYAQHVYKIPKQQIAKIKRESRRYLEKAAEKKEEEK